MTEKANILESYGETIVTLSTANTHSYEKLEIPFKEYVETMLNPRELTDRGDTSWYLFGNNNCTLGLPAYLHPCLISSPLYLCLCVLYVCLLLSNFSSLLTSLPQTRTGSTSRSTTIDPSGRTTESHSLALALAAPAPACHSTHMAQVQKMIVL